MSEIAVTRITQAQTRTSERTWAKRLVVPLLIGHLAALAFGLGGLLIALPNPELWADSALGARTFDFGMTYGGSLHIVFGALTMLAFGAATIGWRKTGTFFVVAYVLSISSELLGTGTGWPFGNYEYTSFLGYQVLGRVPFTIPLSWFYVGFSSYLLANLLFANRRGWQHGALAVIGGAYLLTVWDLVLDPAMAHDSLAVRFWVWSETGPYFGMPIKNFVGWTLTAAAFMAVSRWLWRDDPDSREYPAWLPFTVYLANVIFGIALSLSVGLWEPALLALVFGVVPAALAWRVQWLARRTPEVAHGASG